MNPLSSSTLPEPLAQAYIASRLDEAVSRRTAAMASRRRRSRRRRPAGPDPYSDYLTAREEAVR